MYLIFNTFEEAQTANEQISQNMGLNNNITSQWAKPLETQDSKFIFKKPDEKCMANIFGYNELETVTLKKINAI